MPLLETIYEKERAGRISLLPFYPSARWTGSLLTAAAVIPQTIGVSSDSHLLLRYLAITTYTAGLVISVATAPLLIQLIDLGSGRSLMDSAQPIQNVCGGVAAGVGNGALPFIFPEPWLVRAGGSIQIILTNISAATVVDCIVSLPGMKIYPRAGNLEEI